MSVLLGGCLCSYVGEASIKLFWIFNASRLDLSLAGVIPRFTNVDVSIALGILMFIWGKTSIKLFCIFVHPRPRCIAWVIPRITNVDVNIACGNTYVRMGRNLT